MNLTTGRHNARSINLITHNDSEKYHYFVEKLSTRILTCDTIAVYEIDF
jgi:hypothetical protein